MSIYITKGTLVRANDCYKGDAFFRNRKSSKKGFFYVSMIQNVPPQTYINEVQYRLIYMYI